MLGPKRLRKALQERKERDVARHRLIRIVEGTTEEGHLTALEPVAI